MTRLLPSCLSILAFCTAITSAAPVDPENNARFCTTDDRFHTVYFSSSDCWKAISKFINEKAWPEGRRRFEFLPPGSTGPGTTDDPVAQTVQRWSHGTCTLAITTLSAFGIGELPEVGMRSSPLTDVANYETLSHQIEHAAHTCLGAYAEAGNETTSGLVAPVETQRKARRGGEAGGTENFVIRTGFALAGRSNAVGIFLWDTASVMNSRFPMLPST